MIKWTIGNRYDTHIESINRGRRTIIYAVTDNKCIIFVYESGDPYGKTRVTVYDTKYSKEDIKKRIEIYEPINYETKTVLKNVGIATKAILMQWKELIECI